MHEAHGVFVFDSRSEYNDFLLTDNSGKEALYLKAEYGMQVGFVWMHDGKREALNYCLMPFSKGQFRDFAEKARAELKKNAEWKKRKSSKVEDIPVIVDPAFVALL